MVKNFLIVLENLKRTQKKIASRRAIQETAEATNDLTGNKIADKLQAFRKSLQRNCVQKMMMLIVQQKYQKKRYISPEERQ